MVTSGWFRSSTDLAAAIFGLSARPNRHTLVFEYSTKSTTFSRSGVAASGVMLMSTWFDASTGTLVSWLTSTASSLTPSRRAYSLARSQAGPSQASPAPPPVFSTSQGELDSTPTRKAPDFLIASMRGLAPGAGTGCASAGAIMAPSSKAARKAGMRRLPSRWVMASSP